MRTWLQRALWDVVPRDHRETAEALRRRQVVTVAFVVLGGLVLGFSLRIEPGSAVVLPRHARARRRLDGRCVRLRPAAPRSDRAPTGAAPTGGRPIVLGLALVGVFVLGALVVREVPFLDDQVRSVLDHADRGAVAAAGRWSPRSTGSPRSCSSAAPSTPPSRGTRCRSRRWPTPLATLATGNVMLAFAAVLLGARGRAGAPCLRRDPRRRSSPTSPGRSSMLFVLPLLFAEASAEALAAPLERARTASAYGHRLAGHQVADRVVGDDHLGAHRVDQVAAGGGVDVGDERDPVRRQPRASAPGPSRSAPGGPGAPRRRLRASRRRSAARGRRSRRPGRSASASRRRRPGSGPRRRGRSAGSGSRPTSAPPSPAGS